MYAKYKYVAKDVTNNTLGYILDLCKPTII